MTIILLSFFHVNSLTCGLILTCKATCNNAKLINWETSEEPPIELDSPHYNSGSVSREYPRKNFECQPGDKIEFNINAYILSTTTYTGGFIGKLIVGSETFESYSPQTIFTCSSCSIKLSLFFLLSS